MRSCRLRIGNGDVIIIPAYECTHKTFSSRLLLMIKRNIFQAFLNSPNGSGSQREALSVNKESGLVKVGGREAKIGYDIIRPCTGLVLHSARRCVRELAFMYGQPHSDRG